MNGGNKYKIGVKEIFYYLPKISQTHRLEFLMEIQKILIKKLQLQIILIYNKACRLPYWIIERYLIQMKETNKLLCES
jgi:hypothetical protein